MGLDVTLYKISKDGEPQYGDLLITEHDLSLYSLDKKVEKYNSKLLENFRPVVWYSYDWSALGINTETDIIKDEYKYVDESGMPTGCIGKGDCVHSITYLCKDINSTLYKLYFKFAKNIGLKGCPVYQPTEQEINVINLEKWDRYCTDNKIIQDSENLFRTIGVGYKNGIKEENYTYDHILRYIEDAIAIKISMGSIPTKKSTYNTLVFKEIKFFQNLMNNDYYRDFTSDEHFISKNEIQELYTKYVKRPGTKLFKKEILDIFVENEMLLWIDY